MKKYFPRLAVVCGALFLVLAVVVYFAPAVFSGLDVYFQALAVPLQESGWLQVFVIITEFGSTTSIVVGIFLLMYLYRHRPDLVARMVIAMLGVTMCNEYVKEIVHRARPIPLSSLPILGSYSFPSGHSAESITFYGFFAVLLYVHASSRVGRVVALALPIVIILLIGFSRIVLSYHYASDVLGGFLLGAFWVSFAFAIPLYRELYHQEIAQSIKAL